MTPSTGRPATPTGAARFDPDARWRLAEQVALRPESFGALLYHFGTRRLSFVKDPLLAAVLRALAGAGSAREACRAAAVPADRAAQLERALDRLADTGMITRVEP